MIGPNGVVNTDEVIPYNSQEVSYYQILYFQAFCYICKESFDVGYDEEEETYFFLYAKKIRLHMKSETTIETSTKVVSVHSDCLK